MSSLHIAHFICIYIWVLSDRGPDGTFNWSVVSAELSHACLWVTHTPTCTPARLSVFCCQLNGLSLVLSVTFCCVLHKSYMQLVQCTHTHTHTHTHPCGGGLFEEGKKLVLQDCLVKQVMVICVCVCGEGAEVVLNNRKKTRAHPHTHKHKYTLLFSCGSLLIVQI